LCCGLVPDSSYQLKKIVIIGPESTGKSTLCRQLAEHFQTLWVPEYAREYLTEHGTDYDYDDLLVIAKGQVALEDEYVKKLNRQWAIGNRQSNSQLTTHNSLLFVDTDMYVMKVWCEFVFQKCHPWILRRIVERKYDFYLLCNIDLPWVKDELREYPELAKREQLYLMYKDILINQTVPWSEISGDYEQRLKQAIEVINKFLNQ
jgi:NadR type nicotinamide-nucleotide adenylyltransferase